jgi:cbb3-type cytochrome oxidase cytochrome c subunit
MLWSACGLTWFGPWARAAAPADRAGPLDVEVEDLRPGLVAHYCSRGDANATLVRVDAKPAFTLGSGSPHPRLPPGPFEVTWTGVLLLHEAGPIHFDAFVGGEVTVEVDGATVLHGRVGSATAHVRSGQPLSRPRGVYRLTVRYRSLPDVPARLQIGWQGRAFAREPLPPWQLKHLAADVSPELRDDDRRGRGRRAAGQLGCARCHATAFPGLTEPPPGPSLADVRRRVGRGWLLRWLEEPDRVRPGAHMPALFTPDRKGFVERWLVTEYLGRPDAPGKDAAPPAPGDHRAGRLSFISLGCAACHFLPDLPRAEQADLGRAPLTGLGERLPAADLAAFLANPHSRYPDSRMPRLPVSATRARDIAAYLLLWNKPTARAAVPPPTDDEVRAVTRRLGVRDRAAAAAALLREKRCAACHPGLDPAAPVDVAIRMEHAAEGCLSGRGLPRYHADRETRRALAVYLRIARRERYPSPFEERRRLVERVGCLRCHARDTDRPPPIEEAGSTLGGGFLQYLPYQRTPRLTYAHQQYTRAHLLAAVRDGVSGLRPPQYSYRMPAFGDQAAALVQALAEADGELVTAADAPTRAPADPTLGALHGPSLVGFQGYACVSCHVWNGKMLSEPDPGAAGPDLARIAGRIRRDWFDRFLEGPARSHPGTPMPAIFTRGDPATLRSVLDGDAARQRDALWAYFALGKDAPSPRPPPPLPVPAPAAGAPPLVAQVPIHVPGGVVEAVGVLYPTHDLLIYDVGAAAPHSFYTGARLLRTIQGRVRGYTISGTALGNGLAAPTPLRLRGSARPEVPLGTTLHGYDRLADGVRLRWQMRFASGAVELADSLRLVSDAGQRRLVRRLRLTQVPAGRTVEVRSRAPVTVDVQAHTGQAQASLVDGVLRAVLTPDGSGTADATVHYTLPAAGAVPPVKQTIVPDPGKIDGVLERPGYRAVAYPRPKTSAGDDLVQPAAVAVNPRDGRVFVASMKLGEIFVLRHPLDARAARFEDYGHGLFQDALSLHAEADALYVLHRRNLTRITESRHDGRADRFDRVAALPHGVADSYDYGYGLVRDRTGAFVITYAPYAHTHLPGSGGAVRLVPGKQPQELAFGFRNPLGWCNGPDGEVFFTDNQGEWVATNKLSHLVEGRFYGFPNPAQKQHAARPFARPAVWIPYGWARSLNGVAYDNTGGRFGPFAGQFFLAELMFGGAIIRADVEKVNGEYQGACFPFWGKGLLGPLTLAFDPRGHLYVGGITEPGWMAQPDRGALFRIDFTGATPFEIQSIHVRPRGFALRFTKPVAPASARDPAAYQVEHYRYEYTGAYGSPELDRTRVRIERVEVAADGRGVELTTAGLVKDRVYLISARGVRSGDGQRLVYPTGCYTLNEIPGGVKEPGGTPVSPTRQRGP